MSPLTPDDFRQWRYWRAIMTTGKMLMIAMFIAFTEGQITNTYKDELINYYGLKPSKKKSKTPQSLYESEFNKGERTKLEDRSAKPDTFDITLLDKILRRLSPITGLAFDNDDIWTKDDPPGSNKSIEYMIYKVKLERNTICHEMPTMSETELENKLQELQILYTNLLDCVLSNVGKPKDYIDKEKDKITQEFQDIRSKIREPLTLKDIAEYKKENKEFLDKVQAETVSVSQSILMDEYEETCFTNPCSYLDLGEDFNCETTDIFTEIEIIEEAKNIQNKNEIGKKFDFKNILDQQTKCGNKPRAITLLANGGFGKSTSTRMLVQKWSSKDNSIPGLNLIPILLFVELRTIGDMVNTFYDLIKLRLGKVKKDMGITMENLKDIILSLDILIILDGQDEAPNNNLLIDIVKLISNLKTIRLIVTTRPFASANLQQIITSFNIKKIDLKLIGISRENQKTFITRYIESLEKDKGKHKDILQLVEGELPGLNSSLGEIMMSPLILSLLALLWVTGEILDCLTTTDIFMKINNILEEKLISRLLTRINDVNLEAKLDEFQKYLHQIAFDTFSRKEIHFENETVDLLRKKLAELNLEVVVSQILEHFLTSWKCRKNMRIVINYSYKHLRLQEYDASLHVCYILATCSEEDIDKLINQLSDKRYCNIRVHTIALLAKDTHKLLAKYGKRIIDFEKDDTKIDFFTQRIYGVQNSKEIDSYLRHVFESKEDETVINMVSSIMTELPNWVVKNSSGLAALVALMRRIQPKELSLMFPDQTHLPASFAKDLQEITSYDIQLRLTLPVRPNGRVIQELHNDYLLAITSPTTRATLRSFQGRLDNTSLHILPATLHHLRIGITAEDLPVLWERIPHLTQLSWLDIQVWCSNLERVAELPELKLELQPSRGLVDGMWLTLYGTEDEQCSDIAILVQRYYRQKHGTLGLWDANITGMGAITLLQSLTDQQVKCSYINIESSHEPTEEQKQEMKRLAITCIEVQLRWKSADVWETIYKPTKNEDDNADDDDGDEDDEEDEDEDEDVTAGDNDNETDSTNAAADVVIAVDAVAANVVASADNDNENDDENRQENDATIDASQSRTSERGCCKII